MCVHLNSYRHQPFVRRWLLKKLGVTITHTEGHPDGPLTTKDTDATASKRTESKIASVVSSPTLNADETKTNTPPSSSGGSSTNGEDQGTEKEEAPPHHFEFLACAGAVEEGHVMCAFSTKRCVSDCRLQSACTSETLPHRAHYTKNS